MKRIFYYTTTAIIISCGITQAQTCVPTPTCSSLGYTSSTACDGGLKCPFGSYWYCPSNSGGECAGFTYLCIGRGYVDGGGIGADCNGKYAKCECYEGFEWQDGKGCVESSTECKIGAILYSDMTCSSSGYDNDKGLKTAIGVVVYIGSDGKKWAMALKSIGNYEWGGDGTDISTLPNLSQSQANSAKIRAQGNSSTYPAVWAAYNYTTTGTKVGDWCLPAAGIFTSIYNNQSTINTGFSRANGTKFTSNTYAWSSSEDYYDRAWSSHFSGSYGLNWNYKYGYFEVRPVLEF